MSTTVISKRAASVVAHSYDEFAVPSGALDLRGDNSPLLDTVTTALTQPVVANDLASYGDVQGDLRLRQVLGSIFNLPPEGIVITNGGSEALHLALLCTTEPGDQALLPTPGFPGFDQLAALAALDVAHYRVPGPPPATSNTGVTVVCSPHNPTGACLLPTQLHRDEQPVIWDISHMSPYTPQLRQLTAGLTDHDLVVFSTSKLLRVPGARIGMLASANTDLAAAAVAIKTHLSMSASRLSQQLVTAVLTAPDTRQQVRVRHAILDDHRRRIVTAVAASHRLIVDPCDGGTHLYLHARCGQDAYTVTRDARIVGLPGHVFGADPSAVRLCIAQPDKVIQAAAAILATL
jgi:aspartate/methionine/tyrosine aminotransferase